MKGAQSFVAGRVTDPLDGASNRPDAEWMRIPVPGAPSRRVVFRQINFRGPITRNGLLRPTDCNLSSEVTKAI